jgi:hypothetical protein
MNPHFSALWPDVVALSGRQTVSVDMRQAAIETSFQVKGTTDNEGTSRKYKKPCRAASQARAVVASSKFDRCKTSKKLVQKPTSCPWRKN